MTRLTWQQVVGPDLTSAARMYNGAIGSLTGAADRIGDALISYGENRRRNLSAEAIAELGNVATEGDVAGAIAAVQGMAPHNISNELAQAVANIRGQALDYDNTRSTMAARSAAVSNAAAANARAQEEHDRAIARENQEAAAVAALLRTREAAIGAADPSAPMGASVLGNTGAGGTGLVSSVVPENNILPFEFFASILDQNYGSFERARVDVDANAVRDLEIGAASFDENRRQDAIRQGEAIEAQGANLFNNAYASALSVADAERNITHADAPADVKAAAMADLSDFLSVNPRAFEGSGVGLPDMDTSAMDALLSSQIALNQATSPAGRFVTSLTETRPNNLGEGIGENTAGEGGEGGGGNPASESVVTALTEHTGLNRTAVEEVFGDLANEFGVSQGIVASLASDHIESRNFTYFGLRDGAVIDKDGLRDGLRAMLTGDALVEGAVANFTAARADEERRQLNGAINEARAQLGVLNARVSQGVLTPEEAEPQRQHLQSIIAEAQDGYRDLYAKYTGNTFGSTDAPEISAPSPENGASQQSTEQPVNTDIASVLRNSGLSTRDRRLVAAHIDRGEYVEALQLAQNEGSARLVIDLSAAIDNLRQ